MLGSMVQLVAFLEVDRNGNFDPAIDKTLGQVTLDQLLAVNQSITLRFAVDGDLPFRDAPIQVFVNSNQHRCAIAGCYGRSQGSEAIAYE
jgi:hypothetical protein